MYIVASFGGCIWGGDFMLILSSGGSVDTSVRILNSQRGIIDNSSPIKIGESLIKSPADKVSDPSDEYKGRCKYPPPTFLADKKTRR